MQMAFAESWFSEVSSQTEALPLLLGVVVVTTILIILTRRRARQSRSDDFRPQRTTEIGSRARSDINHEVGELLIQLQTVAREITGQIDTRYRVLEAVIRDADRKIARLETMSGQGAAADKPATHLDVTVGDDCETYPAAEPSNARTSPGGNASRERIYALADGGASLVDIARQIGRPTGEVELILSLRPVRQAATSAH
jgi:hypothetical protein